jgi:hypothetical protein
MFVLLSASSIAQTFSKTDYPVGSQPNGIIAADFNHDGVMDLAVANSGSASVSLLLGQADGTFSSATSIAVGANPTEIVTADFNGDGNPDLAVATSGSITILYMHADGSRTGFDIQTGGPVRSLAAADFNGDGKTDLAADVNGTVQILINHFDKSFSVASTFTTDVSAQVIRAGDFNRDGVVDLAIGACCQGTDVTFGAFFIATGHGDGTFTVAKAFDQSDGTKLTVADVTRDGRPDMVMPYVGCHTPCLGVEVAANNGSSFTRFGGHELGTLVYVSPGQAAVADFNGDGAPEVAAAFGPGDYTSNGNGSGLDKVLIWTVGSDGKFTTQSDYALGAGLRPLGIVAADFNHDGKPDLAVTDSAAGKITVLLNGGESSNFAMHVNFSPQTVKAGDKAQYGYILEALNGALPQVQLSCSGLPTGASCGFENSMTGPVTQGSLTVQTTARPSASLHSSGWVNALAIVLPFGFVAIAGNRRRRLLSLAVLLIALAVMLQAGCGGAGGGSSTSSGGSSTPTGSGGSINSGGIGGSSGSGGGTTTPPPANGPTPVGSYQVTVSATSGGVTHTQVITLNVQ